MTAKIEIVFILTLSLLIEVASAQTPPTVKRLPDYPNPIQGSCRDLRAAAGVGVKDSVGNTYAGATTIFDWSFKLSK